MAYPCSTSLTDHARALLPEEATRLDVPPLYCIYSGSIQGIWKDSGCISLILSTPGGHCGCTVYSWTEAIYTRASGQSFRDILLSSKGWDRLHGVLLELFGNEERFILGPQLMDILRSVPSPPPSLAKTLRHFSESSLIMLQPQQPLTSRPRRSTTHPAQRLFAESWGAEAALLHSAFISSEVADRMYLINSTIRNGPRSRGAEMHEGAPTNLPSRRAKLLKLHPDDFFYEDYVQLVNRTAKLVDEVPVDDSVMHM